jgi:competence protein ComEC
MAWKADGVAFDALGPSEPFFVDGKNDVNENSVVLRLTYRCPACARPFRMLFTGDAGKKTEERLLERGVDVAADVLKVGHHGSAYSSTPRFIAAVHPHIGVISVGRHNLFGHPAASTLATLVDAGLAVFRTDRCGAITLRIETSISAETMIPCTSRG